MHAKAKQHGQRGMRGLMPPHIHAVKMISAEVDGAVQGRARQQFHGRAEIFDHLPKCAQHFRRAKKRGGQQGKRQQEF